MMLIINPISGNGHKEGLADKIAARVAPAGITLEVRETACRGDATTLAREAIDRNFDAVLACGGDGTVNETARAVRDTGMTMGIIPAGSGNGLARHLAIPVDPILCLDVILENHREDCDYGTVNGRPFFCTFGVGYDAAVSDRFANSGRRGKVSYLRSAIEEFMHFQHERYTLNVDGELITDDAFLVACCNASQYGNNAYIAPHASMKDGLLDIVVIEPFPPLEGAQVCLQLFNGTLEKNQHVKTFQTNALHITRPSEGAVHCDGDPFITSSEIDIRIVPQQLRVVVNPFAKKVRQCNLQQSIPEWFKELTTLPPTLQMKTDNLLQLNRNLLEKLRKN